MSQKKLKIVVIGGGAAGFFAAITCASNYPHHEVVLLEKSSKLLAKVKVSGGGRCNVTHACFDRVRLSKHYPRGEKFLKEAFKAFMPQDMIAWLAAHQVTVKTEEDGRMFPDSDDSQTIINCLMDACRTHRVTILTRHDVQQIQPLADEGFTLTVKGKPTMHADRVIVASGGSPKRSGLNWLADLGHSIETPVPSLFSFNIPDEVLVQLQGVSQPHTHLNVQHSKLQSEGPLLITHWGLSGPAILRLSAWGARELQAKGYTFSLRINWMGGKNEEAIREMMLTFQAENPSKKVKNQFFEITKRMWGYFLYKTGISEEKKWGELRKADLNRLVAVLSNDVYPVQGKTTFKEEFVTCGGVSLRDVHVKTLESKKVPGLYFCGEVLDIDGITGGFNFQAAWTTSFLAGQHAGNSTAS